MKSPMHRQILESQILHPGRSSPLHRLPSTFYRTRNSRFYVDNDGTLDDMTEEYTKLEEREKLMEERMKLLAKLEEEKMVLISKNKTLLEEKRMLMSKNETLLEEKRMLISKNEALSKEFTTLMEKYLESNDREKSLEIENKSYASILEGILMQNFIYRILEFNQSVSQSKQEECCVCMDGQRNWAVLRCGHVPFCDDCVREWRRPHSVCPICRQSIESVLKLYF